MQTSIIVSAFGWYFTFALLGALSFPLWKFRFPTEKAWILSRVLGPYLLTSLLFVARIWGGKVVLTRESIAGAMVALLGGGLALLFSRFNRRPPQAPQFSLLLRLLTLEGIAIVLFSLAALYCGYVASVDGPSERLMNTAFWVALHTQATFPLEDPWLSGFTLRYYTLGYYPLALPGLLLQMDSLKSYHFALCSSFSLYGLTVAGILFAAGLNARWVIAGTAILTLGGNLQAVLQAVKRIVLHLPFDWRAPIVAVHDGITEFPLWSLSQTNLHPHFISNFLLVALVLTLATRPRKHFSLATSLVMAGLFTWIGAAHPWELPLFAGVVLCDLVLQYDKGSWRSELKTLLAAALICVLASVPFRSGASHFQTTVGFVARWSTVEELLKAFGLFLLPLWAYLFTRRGPRAVMGFVLAAALIANSALLALSGTLAAVCLELAPEKNRLQRWALPALSGLGILLLCELIYVNDPVNPGTRIATIHKWYPCAWTLLGISSVFLLGELRLALPRRVFTVSTGLWGLALSSYLVWGLPSRAESFRVARAYDGLQASAQTPADDVRMIRWMRGRVSAGELKGVLLEPVGSPYGIGARFSSLTGLPSFIACPDCPHLIQFHAGDPAISDRIQLSRTLFQSPQATFGDCSSLKAALHRSSISWIVLGSKGAERSGTQGFAFLTECLTPAHTEGNSKLLAVR